MTLLGFGDDARPDGQGGMTADLFVKDGRHHFQLVCWSASGLGCEVLSSTDWLPGGFATEADARAAAPHAAEDFIAKFEGFAGVEYQVVPMTDPIGDGTANKFTRDDPVVVQVSVCGACGQALYADEPAHVCDLDEQHMVCEVKDCPGYGTPHPPLHEDATFEHTARLTLELSDGTVSIWAISELDEEWFDARTDDLERIFGKPDTTHL